jgi:hypothetical protein
VFDRQWQTPQNSQNGVLVQPSPLILVFVLVISLLLGSCQSLSASEPPVLVKPPEKVAVGNLKEVAPPRTIQALASNFNQYQPQVAILAPTPDAILNKTTVAVKLQVKDFPFSNAGNVTLKPHLHLILDNEPYRAIYDLDQAIALEDLEPGTHTLRVFPVRPWHESYKNDGAYAQVTFHVLTKTDSNNPDQDLPVLTYSRPKGDYGTEPILLDYYLTNAPLHIAAQTDETLSDWRIRVTINNESFLLDQWQPIYLEGFQPGENWVKLEFIDDQGNLVANRFNNTVRVINYQPGGQDALSRLMREEVTMAEAFTLTGVTVPEFLPELGEIEESVESVENLVIPPTPAITETVEAEEDLNAKSQPEITEPEPTAAPSLVSPMDSEEPTTEVTEEIEEAATEVETTIKPAEIQPNPISATQTNADLDPDNAVTPTIAPNPTVDTPSLTPVEKNLEERLEVLEDIVAEEISPPVADE